MSLHVNVAIAFIEQGVYQCLKMSLIGFSIFEAKGLNF